MTITYSTLFQENRQELIDQLMSRREQGTQEDLCFLALLLGVNGNLVQMKSVLDSISETQISSPELLSIFHEIKIIEAYIDGNFSHARNLAEIEVADNKNAFWAEYALALLDERERLFAKAIQHYKNILDVYPAHSDSLLNICRVIVLSNGSMPEAKNYLRAVKPCFRKKLYSFLLPFLGLDFPKLGVLFLILILFMIPNVGIIVFFLILAFVIAFQVWSISKVKLDFLVIYWTLVNISTVILFWIGRTIILSIIS